MLGKGGRLPVIEDIGFPPGETIASDQPRHLARYYLYITYIYHFGPKGANDPLSVGIGSKGGMKNALMAQSRQADGYVAFRPGDGQRGCLSAFDALMRGSKNKPHRLTEEMKARNQVRPR